MEFLVNILKEELSNSKRMVKLYQKELKSLPKGNIYKKNIGGHSYYYLQYKENNEQICKCLGKLNKKKINEYKKINDKRKQVQANLKEVKKQVKVLGHLLNDKKIQSAA